MFIITLLSAISYPQTDSDRLVMLPRADGENFCSISASRVCRALWLDDGQT